MWEWGKENCDKVGSLIYTTGEEKYLNKISTAKCQEARRTRVRLKGKVGGKRRV
jgi:hypothetical protein